MWNRNFIILWQAQTISALGTQAHGIALLFLIKDLTASGSMMGLLLLCNTLPLAFSSIGGGVLADRWSRQRLLMGCNIIAGTSVLGLCLALHWDYGKLPAIYICAIILALTQGIYHPTLDAAIPDLVKQEHLVQANSLKSASTSTASLMGSALGGNLYYLLGAARLFLLDALSYLLAAVLQIFVRLPRKEPAVIRERWAMLVVEGFNYVRKKPGMMVFFLAIAALNFAAAPVLVLLPFLLSEVLHLGADWFGYHLALQSLGMISGFALASLPVILKRSRFLIVSLALSLNGCAFFGLGLAQSPQVSLSAIGLFGLGSGVFSANVMALLQIATPPELRGRVLGFLRAMGAGLIPMGTLGAGFLLDRLGKDQVGILIQGTGLFLLGVAVLCSLNASFRNYLRTR